MPKSSKEKQDQRKAELQAAALRDGFETWSQALTAWKNGEARLTKRAPDVAKSGEKKGSISGKRSAKSPRR